MPEFRRVIACSSFSPTASVRCLSTGGAARSRAWKTLARYLVSASKCFRPLSLSRGRERTLEGVVEVGNRNVGAGREGMGGGNLPDEVAHPEVKNVKARHSRQSRHSMA